MWKYGARARVSRWQASILQTLDSGARRCSQEEWKTKTAWCIYKGFGWPQQWSAISKCVPADKRHPHLDPAWTPFLKSLFPLPLFLVHPILRYFRQFSPPSHNPLLPLSDQPTFLGLSKYQKGDFTSSTDAFYQKSIFNLLNPFTNSLS